MYKSEIKSVFIIIYCQPLNTKQQYLFKVVDSCCNKKYFKLIFI